MCRLSNFPTLTINLFNCSRNTQLQNPKTYHCYHKSQLNHFTLSQFTDTRNISISFPFTLSSSKRPLFTKLTCQKFTCVSCVTAPTTHYTHLESLTLFTFIVLCESYKNLQFHVIHTMFSVSQSVNVCFIKI